MSDPITEANDVVNRIWTLSIQRLQELEDAAADAEVAHKVAREAAFEQAKGSVVARNYHVDKETAELLRARLKAAGAVRVQERELRRVEALFNLRRSEITTDRFLSGMGT